MCNKTNWLILRKVNFRKHNSQKRKTEGNKSAAALVNTQSINLYATKL